MQGVTPQDPAKREQPAAEKTVTPDGLEGVLRAGGRVDAPRTHEGREASLVEANGRLRRAGTNGHQTPALPRSLLNATATCSGELSCV